MIDHETEIFNEITVPLRLQFTGIYVMGESINIPPSFPAVSIVQKENSIYDKTQDSSGLENHANTMFQIDIFTTGTGKKSQAKSIVEFINDKFIDLGFLRTFCQPIENLSDTTTYRMTARFKAVIGKDKVVYTH